MVQWGLSGQTAVITGGGGILCSRMARDMAAMGVNIAVLDINKQAAEAVSDDIQKAGGRAIALVCNVLEKPSVEAAAAAVLKEFGQVDILINGAGGNKPAATASPDQSFFDIPAEALQWVFNLNLTGAILPSQVFGRSMAQAKKGNIINISSMSAYVPLTRVVAYSAAKAGITNFTQWLAVYMNREASPDIRVNAIAPGFLLTEQNYFLLKNEDGSDTPRGQSVLHKTPMNRYGNPEDLVGAVCFLCSDAAAFITGTVLPVDGGFLAFSGV